MEENKETSAESKKKYIPIVILAIVVLAVVGYFVFGKNKIFSPASSASVATVNGVTITKTAYDTLLDSSLASYKAQGVDVTDATKLSQIKTQVLNNLISDELINQGVVAAGIKITSEDVEKQFQAIVTQTGGAEKFQAELVKNNLTEAQLRENVSKQMAIQKYLLQNIDTKSVTVSDAEISQFYSDYTKAQKASDPKAVVPALKDLSDQIKQQIITNKEQAMVVSFIDALRAKANVVTSL
jgi:hypothetical protein